MRISVLFLVLFSFLALGVAPAAADERHAEVQLLSAVTAVGAGETLPLGLRVKLDKGWHTYWRTPGEAGLAPALDWSGSTNLKSAALLYPAPRRFTTLGLDNFGYEKEVVFPIDAVPSRAGETVDFNLKLDLLVCSDICLPETHQLSLALPAGPARSTAFAPLRARALKAVPRQDDGAVARAWLDYDSANVAYLAAELPMGRAPGKDADLFVEHGSGLSFGAPRVSYDRAAKKALMLAPLRGEESYDKALAQMTGSPLTLTFVDGARAVESRLGLSPRPKAEKPLPAQGTPPVLVEKTFDGLRVALFAFLGGLILNLMPCVLPVLSLKILSVLSHGGKEKSVAARVAVFRAFSASALGILCSFWLMAGALIALKLMGETVGWGIQFQNPVFISFLIFVVLFFAANMWGVFEIPLPRFIARRAARHDHEPTLTGHFLTGAFATLLATPCTAPFLGTAVGFALARGPSDILAVFTMVGLGLAAPYIFLAVSPGLFRLMPKPGVWMVKLKKVLALALVLTAVWLGSVLSAILTTSALDEGWEKFDAALIAPAVERGQIVVVDVTADWCLTCKANKRLVLDSAEVVEALSGPEILRLQADWTQRDEAIAAYLRRFGRYGIPFNVIYGPGAPQGVLLPELLSAKVIMDGLAQAAGE